MVALLRQSWGVAGAMLGGGLWAVHAAVLASRPEGCVADECALSGVTPRPSEDLAWQVLLAVVAMALAARVLTDAGPQPGRRLIRVGTGLLWSGAALLAVGVGVNAVLPGDSPLWWLHDSDSSGRIVPVVGSLLTGVGVVRMRWLPPWIGIGLVLSALVSLPYNAQDERALLDLPLGLAWLLLGLLWAVRRGAPRRSPVPTP